MTSAIIPAIIVGGVVYTATQTGTSSPPGPAPGYGTGAYPGNPIPGSGSAPGVVGATTQNPVRRPAGTKAVIQLGASTLSNALGIGAATQKTSAWQSPANYDPELQKKFDLIEAAAKKNFEDANEVAKAKAAETLNKELKLDPPLTGHEDWKTVSAVVGGATGGAVGAAIAGPIGAKLGALVGAYLGVKLEELIEKNWDDLEDWIGDKWGDIKDFASDAYDEVAGWIPG